MIVLITFILTRKLYIFCVRGGCSFFNSICIFPFCQILVSTYINLLSLIYFSNKTRMEQHKAWMCYAYIWVVFPTWHCTHNCNIFTWSALFLYCKMFYFTIMVKLTFLNNICFLFGTSKNQEFEMSVQFWSLSFQRDR